MMTSFVKKTAVLAASILGIGLSTSALAIPSFTLSPGNVSPTLVPTSFTADTLSGVSSELLTVTAAGTTGSGFLRFTSATINTNPVFTNFFQQGNPAAGQYNLYLTFQLSDTGTGSVGTQAPVTMLNFQVFLDPQHDDVFTAAGISGNTSTAASVATQSNDVFLAFGTLISGVDGFDTQGGAFLNSTQFFNVCSGVGTANRGGTSVAATSGTSGTNGNACSLNEGGSTGFFTVPVPFYSIAFDGFNNNGNPTNVQRGTGPSNFNQIAIVSAVGNVSFAVPEPGSVALLGIAAAAAGLASRRRKS